VFVTHDQVEAMTLADRIVVLRAGRVEQVGAPTQLYDDPDNLFVAGFIGSPRMNFIDAAVTGIEGKMVRVKLPGFGGTELAAVTRTGNAAIGDKLILGIRPEHFTAAAGAPVSLAATTQVVEQLGGVSYVHATGEDGTEITIQESGHSRLPRGEVVRFGIRPDLALLFTTAGIRL
jgi:lactose/L-arabinose transport system ATP-binding protein